MAARLYIRVSRDEQVKFGYSIDAQIERLNKYTKDNGIKVIDTYIDEGISAATVSKRHNFVKMINDCEDGDVILFTKLDRFSRNLIDANNIVKILEEKNVSIKAIDEDNIDTTSADGKFIFNLKLSLAERERGKTSERINDVFKYRAGEGYAISARPPFGYKIKNKRYVFDSPKAEALKDAFEMMVLYKSGSYALKIFNQKYPEYKMEYRSFLNKLKNRIYVGEHKYNKEFCDKLIANSLFDEVQDILNKNNIKTRKTKSLFLFSGLCICSTCKRKMTGNKTTTKYDNPNWKTSYTYLYRCNHAYQNRMCTNRHVVSERKIEEYLLNNIKFLISQYLLDIDKKNKKQKDHSTEITSIKAKMSKLKNLYLDDLILKDEYESTYKELNERLSEISKMKPIKANKRLKEILDINIQEHYKTLDRRNKQALWQNIIKSITIDEEKNFNIIFI